jgi:type IV secretory pathway VirB4 component
MIKQELSMFTLLEDKNHPLTLKYSFEDSVFYIEPMFYTQMENLKALRPEEFSKFFEGFIATIRKNKKVIFTADYELPHIQDLDDYIYREITDITDPLEIFVEDKSRGSDYGD